MLPSDRVKEIHNSLKILDSKDIENLEWNSPTYWEKAILKYLDETIQSREMVNDEKKE